MKKKTFDISNPSVWIGCFTLLAMVCGFILKWGSIPARVYAVEQTNSEIKDWIKEQQIANRYYREKEEREEQIVYSPDGRFYLDHKTNEWHPVSQQRGNR